MKLGPTELVQMRVAHLGMIQGVIGRLANTSAVLKGFCVTLTAALLAFQSEVAASRVPLLLGLILVFALMDAGYLGMEREFRRLYKNVCNHDLEAAADLSITRPQGNASAFLEGAKSWSVLGFYLPLAIGAMTIGVVGR